ncbi:MAG: PAS domain S-box protein, partial [Candidatus Zixiibacteriota bacterium]
MLKHEGVQSSVESVKKPEIPVEVRGKWQRIVNLMAKVIDVPAGLIMKVEPPYIQVFISSATDGNPYRVGDTEHLAGLYCETVIESRDMLLVPDAPKDEKWKYNPDMKLGMISYLGLLLVWPDGEPFGTICVLDNKENEYSELYIDLMREFRDVVETDLQSLCEHAQIEKSSEEWMKTFDAISDFVFILDKDSRFVRVNKATCDILKKEPEELIGKRCFEVLHGTDKPWPNCPHRKALVTKKAATAEINDSNLGLPLLVTVSPIFDDEGEFVGSVHVAKDITERKKAEEKIWESEKKYRVLYETIRDGISATDMDGRIVECNQAYADMLGYSKDELKNLTWQQLTPKQWHQMEANIMKEQILKRSYSDEYEKEYIRKDGTVFPISIRVWVIRGEDGKRKGKWAIIRDITERKRAEEKIRKEKEFTLSLLKGLKEGFAVI